jgi:hypothetical protein
MRLKAGRFGAVAGAVGVAVAAGWAAAQGVAAPSAVGSGELLSPPPGALVAPGDPADLTVLFTGDVIGYLDPCG